MDPTQVTPRAYTQGRVRFSDPWKFLPVAFICFTIGALYLIYVFSHCASLLQFDVSAKRVDDAMRQRGIMHLFVFHVITALVLTCYVRSILVHPGEVPDTDKWIYAEGRMPTPIETATLNLQETKKTGARRYCKWCEKYKPDRCHHCRVCRQCILKMDHHCPWIYNCVGFHNYKYFFLLLVYSGIGCIWIPMTMLESVVRSVNDDDPIWTMFCLFFGQTLAIFLQVLIWSFLSFHIYLGLKAMTTIEYCEKNMPKDPHAKQGGLSFETSVYDLGTLGNIKAVLGPNPWLWFLPCSPPQGDGMNFVGEEIRLTKDLEAGKGMRRKGHQQAQRQSRNARAMWGDDGEDWSGPAR